MFGQKNKKKRRGEDVSRVEKSKLIMDVHGTRVRSEPFYAS